MTKIVVTDKTNHYTSKQTISNDVVLKEPSVVALNLKQSDIKNIEYVGNQLIITLQNGEKITVQPVNVVNGQLDTDLVLLIDGGQFDHALMKKSDDGEWIFEKYTRLNTIDPLLENQNSGLGMGAWAGIGAGILGAGVALANSGDSDDSSENNGTNGINGTDGVNGVDGKDGVNGTDGKDGVNGTDGKDGVNGTDGKDGANGGVDGKDGVNGTDGKDGVNGADGKDGIDGADGKDGVNGTDGKDGVNGADGKDGVDGIDGTNGTDGTNGADGKDGIDGVNGADGKDGIDGNNGADGKDGVNGIDGTNGTNGTDGVNGTDGKDGADGKDGVVTVKPLENLVEPLITENSANILAGSAISGQTVTIVGEDGKEVATTIVDENGVWSLDPNPLSGGKLGSIYVENDLGETSKSFTLKGHAEANGSDQAVFSRSPVIVEVNEDTGTIYGEVTDYKVGDVVKIILSSGRVVEVTPNIDGIWNAPNILIDNKIANVLVQGADGGYSYSVSVSKKPELLTPTINGDSLNSDLIEGTGTVGSTIVITNGRGEEVSRVQVGDDGTWSVRNPLSQSEVGTFQASLMASRSNTLVAQRPFNMDGVELPKLTVDLNTTENLSGMTQAGNEVYIFAKLQDGSELNYITLAREDGSWSLPPNMAEILTLTNATLMAYTKNALGYRSNVEFFTSSGVDILERGVDSLSGKAVPNSVFTLQAPNQDLITVTTDANGDWTATNLPFNPFKEAVFTSAYVSKSDGFMGGENDIYLFDATPQPTGVYLNGSFISGYGASGNIAIITTKDGQKFEAPMDENGYWSMSVDAMAGSFENNDSIQTQQYDPNTQLTSSLSDAVISMYYTTPQVSLVNKEKLSGYAQPFVDVKLVDHEGVEHFAKSDASGVFKFEPNPLTPSKDYSISAVNTLIGIESEINTSNWYVSTPSNPNINTLTPEELSGYTTQNVDVKLVDHNGVEYITKADASGFYKFEPNPLTPTKEFSISAVDTYYNVESPVVLNQWYVGVPSHPSIYVNTIEELSGYSVPNSTVRVTNSVGDVFETKADEAGNFKFTPSPIGESEIVSIIAIEPIANLESVPNSIKGVDLTPPIITFTAFDENGFTLEVNESISSELKLMFKSMITGQVQQYQLSPYLPYGTNEYSFDFNHYGSVGNGLNENYHLVGVKVSDIVGNTLDMVVNSPKIHIGKNLKGTLSLLGVANEEFIVKSLDGTELARHTFDANGELNIIPNPYAFQQVKLEYVEKQLGFVAENTVDPVIYETKIVNQYDNLFEIEASRMSGYKIYDKDFNMISQVNFDTDGNYKSGPILQDEKHDYYNNPNRDKNLDLYYITMPVGVVGETYYLEGFDFTGTTAPRVAYTYGDNSVVPLMKIPNSSDANMIEFYVSKSSIIELTNASGQTFTYNYASKNGYVNDVVGTSDWLSMGAGAIQINPNEVGVNLGESYTLKVTDVVNGVVQEKEYSLNNDFVQEDHKVEILSINETDGALIVSGISTVKNGMLVYHYQGAIGDGNGYYQSQNLFTAKTDANGHFSIQMANVSGYVGLAGRILNTIAVYDENSGRVGQILEVGARTVNYGSNYSSDDLEFGFDITSVTPTKINFITTDQMGVTGIVVRDLNDNSVVAELNLGEAIYSQSVGYVNGFDGITVTQGEYIVHLKGVNGSTSSPLFLTIDENYNITTSKVLPDRAQLGEQDAILDILNFASDNGGNDLHTVQADHFEESNIDISELFIGFKTDDHVIGDFLTAVLNDNGSTTVQIDRDGQGERFNSVDLIVFEGVHKSIDELLAGQHLIV